MGAVFKLTRIFSPFGKCLFLAESLKQPCSVLSKRWEYTSSYSPKNLYPESSQNLRTPSIEEVCTSTDTQDFSGYIPLNKVQITCCRSSGPGGQHVNKVNTKVELRFHVASADWLSDHVKERLLEAKKNSLTKEGYLIVKSEKTRSQTLNLADVMQRLRIIIHKAIDVKTYAPNPETEERIRKRKEKANRERLKMKKFRSLTKQSRSVDIEM